MQKLNSKPIKIMSITEQIDVYLKRNTENSTDKAILIIDDFCKGKNIQLSEIEILKNEWKEYKSNTWLGLNQKDATQKLKNIYSKINSICRKLEPYQEGFTNFYVFSKSKPKIFVSFNKDDKDKVDMIESYIGNEFAEVIRFDKHFIGSKDIEESIDESISDSRITLLIVTYSSLSSSWVWEEVYLSLRTEKALKRKLFICSFDDTLFDADQITQISLDIERKNQIIEKEIKKRRTNAGVETYDIDDDRLRIIVHSSTFIDTVKKLKRKPIYSLFGELLQSEFDRLINDIKKII